MKYSYDNNNIFAKILRNEIPKQVILETEYSLAFRDINPQAPIHVLVIPKGQYINFDDFIDNASNIEIDDFYKAQSDTLKKLGSKPIDQGNGYRLISNSGIDALQEVPHFHVHILAGKSLGNLVS